VSKYLPSPVKDAKAVDLASWVAGALFIQETTLVYMLHMCNPCRTGYSPTNKLWLKNGKLV